MLYVYEKDKQRKNFITTVKLENGDLSMNPFKQRRHKTPKHYGASRKDRLSKVLLGVIKMANKLKVKHDIKLSSVTTKQISGIMSSLALACGYKIKEDPEHGSN